MIYQLFPLQLAVFNGLSHVIVPAHVKKINMNFVSPKLHTATKIPFMHSFSCNQNQNHALQRTNTENSEQIFQEKELRGLSPSFHILVSVSDLYIPRIDPHISCSRTGRSIVG